MQLVYVHLWVACTLAGATLDERPQRLQVLDLWMPTSLTAFASKRRGIQLQMSNTNDIGRERFADTGVI